jgi:hypothetical protein
VRFKDYSRLLRKNISSPTLLGCWRAKPTAHGGHIDFMTTSSRLRLRLHLHVCTSTPIARRHITSMLLAQRFHGPAVRAMRSGVAVADVRPTSKGRGPKASQDQSAAMGVVLTPTISVAAPSPPTLTRVCRSLTTDACSRPSLPHDRRSTSNPRLPHERRSWASPTTPHSNPSSHRARLEAPLGHLTAACRTKAVKY